MTTLHQETDTIPGKRVTAAFLGVVLAIIIGTAAAYGLADVFRSGRADYTRGPVGDGASRDVAGEVNQIERTLFGQASGLEERALALRALETYGWVDRQAGLVQIPIDRAMEIYLRRHQEEGR